MFLSFTNVFLILSASINFSLAAPSPQELPPLSDYIREHLKTRHPSEYEVGGFGNNLTARDVQGMLETRALQLGMEVGGDDDSLFKRAQLNGRITRCTTSSCLALTFDDGPYDQSKDLDLFLTNQGIQATYFVNGFNFRCIYDGPQVSTLRRRRAQGHEIASHTWSHPDLNTISYEAIDRQVQLLEDALYKTTGVVPAIIRPPFGSASDSVIGYLNDRWGLVVVNWNYDSGDTRAGYTVQDGLNVYRGLKAPRHAIVLNHETVDSTPRTMIPQAIDILRGNGYTTNSFVTVSEGLRINPYKLTANHQSRDSSWTCDGKPTPGQG